MNGAALFFTLQGRIGRGRFWLGALALGAVQALACLISGLAWFACMVLAYGWICLFSKRLHDMGRSGWLTMGPVLASLIALSVAAATFWATTFAKASGAPAMPWLCLTVLAAATLADVAFVAWVGFSPGEPPDEDSLDET